MKRTYTRTMLHKDLKEATFELHLYTQSKFDEDYDFGDEKIYKVSGVTSWDVIEGGDEAREIEENLMKDENREYLVLHFEDGRVATYRNSRIDMFIW